MGMACGRVLHIPLGWPLVTWLGWLGVEEEEEDVVEVAPPPQPASERHSIPTTAHIESFLFVLISLTFFAAKATFGFISSRMLKPCLRIMF